MRPLLLIALLVLSAASIAYAAGVEPVPAAVASDPPRDTAHPAGLKAIALPVKGGRINAVLFRAAGAGPHPAVLLLHGLPGNEQNLDLAQDMRRDGWDVLTLHYRGAWGSSGVFTFAHCLEDAASALAWMRASDGGGMEGIDRRHIAVVGHSMGAWVSALTLASDPDLLGAGMISPADLGAMGALSRPQRIAAIDGALDYGAGMRALEGASPETLADEASAKSKAFSLVAAAEGVRGRPVLVVSADDGLAGIADAYAKAAQAGGDGVTTSTFETDHSYSDKRIALGALLLRWLENLPGAPAAM
jgi:pimeloyl-ACP methyl ester carboxylesterase